MLKKNIQILASVSCLQPGIGMQSSEPEISNWWKQFWSAEAEAFLHEKDIKFSSFKEKHPDG